MITNIHTRFEIGNNRIYDDVHDLTDQASKVKSMIFKNIIMGEDVDKKTIQSYLGYVNSFLTVYEDYADNMEDLMKKTNGVEGVKTIPYEMVKDYIYISYDYASALPFVDGLIKLINDEKVENNNDVVDFFEHTVSKAFKDRATTTGGLVDEVITTFNNYSTSIDLSEAKKFNAVKNQNIFKSNDRKEIYKTISEVLKFLENDLNKNRYVRTRDMKLLVSFINNAIEYLTYTITAYATRIAIISKYAYPFILREVPNEDTPVDSFDESVDAVPNISKITVMSDLDEALARDNTKIYDYLQKIIDFDTAIGTNVAYTIDNVKAGSLPLDKIKDNIIANALIENSFYEFLRQRIFEMFDEYNYMVSLLDLKNDLNEYLNSPSHALPTKTTYKQAMMQTIRNITPKKDNKEGYVELASDVSSFAMFTLGKIKSLMSRLIDARSEEGNKPNYNNSVLTIMAEIVKQLNEIYKEISVATLSKLRDIEMKINEIDNKEDDFLKDLLSIKVPGGNESDYSSKNNMMTAVPDTERTPLDVLDLYAKPELEYYQMCTEYTSTLLPGDAYFVEAAGVIDTLKALIDAIFKAIVRRFEDPKLKAACDWVDKHRGNLIGMTYSGEMTVLPYGAKTNGQSNHIQITYIDDVVKNLTTGVNADSNFKDIQSFDAFIESLYKPDDLKKIFLEGNDDEKTKLNKYKNWVRFGNINDPQQITLKNDEIKSKVPVWMNAVTSSRNLVQQFKYINDGFKNAVNAIDRRFANQTATTNTNNNQQETNNQQQNNDQNNNNQQETQSSLTPAYVTQKITKVSNDLYRNIELAVYQAINDQYRYIQQAYGLAKK